MVNILTTYRSICLRPLWKSLSCWRTWRKVQDQHFLLWCRLVSNIWRRIEEWVIGFSPSASKALIRFFRVSWRSRKDAAPLFDLGSSWTTDLSEEEILIFSYQTDVSEHQQRGDSDFSTSDFKSFDSLISNPFEYWAQVGELLNIRHIVIIMNSSLDLISKNLEF